MHNKPKYDSPFKDVLKLEKVLDGLNSPDGLVPEQLYLIEQENIALMNTMLEEMKECNSIDRMEQIIQTRTQMLTLQIESYNNSLILLQDRPYSKQILETQLQGLVDQRALYFNIRESILNTIMNNQNARPIELLEKVQSIVTERELKFTNSPYALGKKNYELN
jgi:16S rRNA G966 N2-methylase RsmD